MELNAGRVATMKKQEVKVPKRKLRRVAEMHMVGWMCGVIRKDGIKNEHRRGNSPVASIEEEIK